MLVDGPRIDNVNGAIVQVMLEYQNTSDQLYEVVRSISNVISAARLTNVEVSIANVQSYFVHRRHEYNSREDTIVRRSMSNAHHNNDRQATAKNITNTIE
jgi:hypothetical protein